jgi:hypothetical protein
LNQKANKSNTINETLLRFFMNGSHHKHDAQAQHAPMSFDSRGMAAAAESSISLRRPNLCGYENIRTGPPRHLGAAKPRFEQTLAHSL